MWQDVRFAIRGMLKARGVSMLALLTLAIGIGANTTIFSLVNGVLLQPLPFPHAAQLVQLQADLPGVGATNVGFSEPELEDLRNQAGIFDAVSVVFPGPANITGGERPERIQVLVVSRNYFDMLGAKPQLGRLFDQRDIAEGFAETIVISDGLWHRLFGGASDIVGRKVQVDNDLYVIVGVLQPDFRHPAPASEKPTEIWATAGFRAAPFPGAVRNARLLPNIIGRLKPEITAEQAQAKLTTLANSLRKDYGSDYPANSGWTITLTPLKDVVVGNSQTLLLALLLAVSLILLIACVNVASLLLARSSTRQSEMAVRIALGANRSRIVRQLLTESALLSLSAAIVGFAGSWFAERALIRLLPQQLPRAEFISIDARMLLFSILVAMLISILFGLAPALQTARLDVNALKRDGRSGETTIRSGATRRWLVGAEVALSLTLVIGAGLLLRTFWELLHVNPGFSSDNVLAATVWLPVPNDPKTDIYATSAQRTALIREWVRRLHTISGVEAAAVSSALPLRNQLQPAGFRVEGKDDLQEPPTAYRVIISPEFMGSIGATVLRGRNFGDADDTRTNLTALVDEEAARQLWGNQDPIGRHLHFAGKFMINGKLQDAPWITVVGVVSNIKFGKLDERVRPHIYSSAYQVNGKFLNVVVRATGDPATVARDIQTQMQAVDPNLPISDVAPMTEIVMASVADHRFAALLVALFAMVALGLAAVGVYGIAAYSVQQRTREFGIRSAMGATTSDLVRIMLGDSMMPVLTGLAVGILGAALAGRALSSLLFGVHTVDPLVYVVSSVVLLLVGLSATYIPARRIGKIDPNLALRCE